MIEIITHYCKDEPDCDGDYTSVEVRSAGKEVASFGDYYHDKGDIAASAFVLGWNAARKAVGLPKERVKRTSIADEEY